MSKRKVEWNTEENAQAYADYVDSFSMYKSTSKDLVALCDVQKGSQVVDLAAGTGAATQEILNYTEGDVEIIAVDQSSEMLEQAKKRFSENTNIEYAVSNAEELGEHVSDPVEYVLSNAAFWQMKTKEVLPIIHKLLKVDGMFAFNLPDQYFDHPDFTLSVDRKFPPKYTRDELVSIAEGLGFELLREEVKIYTKTIDEVVAFSRIPVMKQNFDSPEKEKEWLDYMNELKAKGEVRQSEWAYFVFGKK